MVVATTLPLKVAVITPLEETFSTLSIVANVDTPTTFSVLVILTSSSSDLPSTSKLPLASMLPENVASSATFRTSKL